MTFETVEIAGMKVELWRAGAGRPLVYLHPGDGIESSGPLLDALARRYQVYAPSHPGFGATELPTACTTVDDLSYFYLDFLERPELAGAVLVGVSFGAWIAAEIAVKCTHGLSGLVLADAVGARFADPTTREIADLFSCPQYEQATLLYSDGRTIDYAGMSDELLLRLARNHASFGLFAWSPTLNNPKLRHRLHRIDVPTLLLWGALDRVVPPAYGHRFAQSIPGARLELIEDAGHYAQVEQTERFVGALDRFVESLPNPAGRAH